MKRSYHTLELLTPCFCAGADQARAEIRAPTIRGQLRWWFRALGGSADDERTVFGGVAGSASTSALTVRVGEFKSGPPWNPPEINRNSPDSYVWYFASVSGKRSGAGAKIAGPRWNPQGALSPKSTFRLNLLQTRPLPSALQVRLDDAIRCFLQLGALGLRVTRGLGAFACHETPYVSSTLDLIASRGFTRELRDGGFPDHNAIAGEIGKLVKGTRKEQGWKIDTMSKYPVSTPSPLGASDPRQTSAVYFRPVRLVGETNLRLVVFQAPTERVLNQPSRKGDVIPRLAYPPPV